MHRATRRELYVVDADGSDERRLTETTAHEELRRLDAGRRVGPVLARPDAQGDYDLYAVRADGECEVRLTDTAASEAVAVLDRPDGLARLLG